MSNCPKILDCLPQISVQMKRQWAVLHGGGSSRLTAGARMSPGKGWSQTPWEHESTPPCPTHGCQDRLNHFLGVSASLCWLEETFRWLSAARVPCEWLNARTLSNLQQGLWLVEGSALKTSGKAFMCKLGDCFGCILFLSLFWNKWAQ